MSDKPVKAPTTKMMREVAGIIESDTNMQERVEFAAWLRAMADGHDESEKQIRAFRVGILRRVNQVP